MNIKNTFFGFTDGMSPMQKSRTEKLLNKKIKYKNSVMTEKEFVYNLLSFENATSEKENDYSYWSKKTGEMTKPKTVYRLVYFGKDEYKDCLLSTEINKTLYDYSLYLIDNKYINEDIANAFVKTEELTFKNQILELEKQKQELIQQKEKEAIKLKNYQEWFNTQVNNYNDQEKINLAVNTFKEMIGVDLLINDAKKLLVKIENIDNENCKENLKEILHTGNKASRKIFSIITGLKLPSNNKETREFLTNLKKGDFIFIKKVKNNTNKTKTNKKNYKIYRLFANEFRECYGEHVRKYDLDFFIVSDNNKYQLIEGTTGVLMFTKEEKTDLLKELDKIVENKGIEHIKLLLGKCIEKNGKSPLNFNVE